MPAKLPSSFDDAVKLALRSDAVFKLIADRLPDDDALASQPTLSRFENAIDPASLFRLQDVFLDQFLASFAEPPTHLTFDVDVFDDPTHGQPAGQGARQSRQAVAMTGRPDPPPLVLRGGPP